MAFTEPPNLMLKAQAVLKTRIVHKTVHEGLLYLHVSPQQESSDLNDLNRQFGALTSCLEDRLGRARSMSFFARDGSLFLGRVQVGNVVVIMYPYRWQAEYVPQSWKPGSVARIALADLAA